MLDQREPPRCKGLEIEVGAARERVDHFKNRARAVSLFSLQRMR